MAVAHRSGAQRPVLTVNTRTLAVSVVYVKVALVGQHSLTDYVQIKHEVHYFRRA